MASIAFKIRKKEPTKLSLLQREIEELNETSKAKIGINSF